MKKISIFIMAAFLSTVTFSACLGNDTSETIKEAVVKKESPVEVIYFHGKQRCKTCIAIENETKTLMEGELANLVKSGKVKFHIVDISSDEGEVLATKFKVSFSSLLVVTKDGIEDLTHFAFSNARTNAEAFRKELKSKIMEAIK